MSASPLRIEAVAQTHVGLVRRANEDSFCARPDEGLWAVADGMGGHAHGDWASKTLADALEQAALPVDFEQACQVIADAIHIANAAIWQEAERRGQQMGSTVAVLFVRDRRFAVLWVGDSRVYLARGDSLYRLTHDHTQVQEMVDRGLLQPEEAASHPRGHVLARAVGVGEVLDVDGIVDAIEPGDLFLLCSDGLTGPVGDEELADLLANGEARPTLDRLIALTLERGAPDNVTAILVRARETTLLSLTGLPGGFS
jgi:serine/threonine protein phosphatase PrpC